MIQKVSFRNFKAYRSLDMELEPFTVLVGPNASGKTTLLEGLYLLSEAAQELLEGGKNFWPGPSEARTQGVQASVEIGVEGVWQGQKGFVKASSIGAPIRMSGQSALPFRMAGEWSGKEFFAGEWRDKGPSQTPSGIYGAVSMAALEQLRTELSSTAILQFETNQLGEASYSQEPIPQIDSDGAGLASVLAYLKLSQDEVFEEIEEALRKTVPSVRRIRIERAQVEQSLADYEGESEHKVWGNRLVLDMQGAKGVSADAAGEGTLMALGLLTVLLAPPHPRLVLLDDIELKLHPAAQEKLIQVLRSIQSRNPELQIVATSHSPFILNYLDPKEVRMTFLAENGVAHCEKLTAHPEFEKWKDLMSPGEFWSTVGESWLEKAGEASASK